LPCDQQVCKNVEEFAHRIAGPDGPIYFDAHIRERKPAHFPSSFADAEVTSLCTPRILGELLQASQTLQDSTDVFTGSHLVRLKDILHRSGREPADMVTRQLFSGATVRFRNLENQTRVLRDLGVAISRIFGGVTTINAYLTPGGQKGFPPHFDNTDVFILQVLGAKRWTLFENYTNRQDLPVRDQPWDPQRYRPNGEEQSFTLYSGDVVYIPRGCMHAAECVDDISLHLTISLDPRTCVDAIRSLLEEWAEETLEARQRLPGDAEQAIDSVRRLAAKFGNWLARKNELPDKAPRVEASRAEIGDAALRFSEAIETMRAPRNGT
jgi:hypothetical protein